MGYVESRKFLPASSKVSSSSRADIRRCQKNYMALARNSLACRQVGVGLPGAVATIRRPLMSYSKKGFVYRCRGSNFRLLNVHRNIGQPIHTFIDWIARNSVQQGKDPLADTFLGYFNGEMGLAGNPVEVDLLLLATNPRGARELSQEFPHCSKTISQGELDGLIEGIYREGSRQLGIERRPRYIKEKGERRKTYIHPRRRRTSTLISFWNGFAQGEKDSSLCIDEQGSHSKSLLSKVLASLVDPAESLVEEGAATCDPRYFGSFFDTAMRSQGCKICAKSLGISMTCRAQKQNSVLVLIEGNAKAFALEFRGLAGLVVPRRMASLSYDAAKNLLCSPYEDPPLDRYLDPDPGIPPISKVISRIRQPIQRVRLGTVHFRSTPFSRRGYFYPKYCRTNGVHIAARQQQFSTIYPYFTVEVLEAISALGSKGQTHLDLAVYLAVWGTPTNPGNSNKIIGINKKYYFPLERYLSKDLSHVKLVHVTRAE
ncbi:uncharacterized protein BDR25DRAFT_361333 [Lindgomyces ingoldianus]|uniref:Uncharacterized protein n=1 Tax=Lindgomyces ingoldianus TaxID=673940 RepID=A0ACB6QCW7_9PLEO|nr:uncharacterized protein BDR25DRAFT_361333 [Lindgomyces ingoldianus]KAF2464793.1 hypothetical protein BDR25DRAFT_361333 [Lindgomyces ingoldianus]